MRSNVSLTVILFVMILAAASIATADVPHQMNYQGQLTDDLGAPLDTIVSMTFTIYSDSSGGMVLWTETQTGVEVSGGLFSVLLGSGTPIPDTVFADDWRWLGIQIDSDPEISPKTKLVTVPYAFRVATVDGSTGGVISGDVSIQSDLDVDGDVSAGFLLGGALYAADYAGIGMWPDPMANLSVAQTGDFAAFFGGNVLVTGFLMKEGGGFKIDHPLDPKNKYLNHSFVESPDMKNVYDGIATLDAKGEALVRLPDYFEAANKDFRYQLTCIGGFAPVYIADEISGNQFKIAGGEPGMKVSWLVTGIRKDPVAEAKRIQVEVDKEPVDRGRYLSPEAYGLGEEYGIYHKRHERMEGEPKEKSVGQSD